MISIVGSFSQRWESYMPPSPPPSESRPSNGVQLLSAPDSVPPQHSGRPLVHSYSHPVLLGRPVPVFRNHVHTVNSEYRLLFYTGKITTCKIHMKYCFHMNFSLFFSHEIHVKISSCVDECMLNALLKYHLKFT